MVPRIQLSKELTRSVNDPAQLKSDFQEWIEARQRNEEETSYIFSDYAPKNIGSTVLNHVHMVPLNEKDELIIWNKLYSLYSSKRRSNRYLFYVNGGLAHGYLLLYIINDPHGHQVWKKEVALIKQLEKMADDFFHFGKIPT